MEKTEANSAFKAEQLDLNEVPMAVSDGKMTSIDLVDEKGDESTEQTGELAIDVEAVSREVDGLPKVED
eukprot:2658131-Rhodomonas_salina.1